MNHIPEDEQGRIPGEGARNPYSVPEGYFDGLAASILAKVKAGGEVQQSATEEIRSLSPLLAAISRDMPYAVPAGYFLKTIEELPALTAEEEGSALLNSISKTMPFRVPAGYFEAFPEKMRTIMAPAKVIPMVRRKWMRLAVAAVTAGVIALAGLLYFTTEEQPAQNGQPIAQQLKNVSVKEMDAFINSTDITPLTTETVSNSKTTPEVKRLLNDVPDAELDAFLKQVPTEDEDLLGIN